MNHSSSGERLLDLEERQTPADRSPLSTPGADPPSVNGERFPTCWRRDEHGNLYRLLTPSERMQVERSPRHTPIRRIH